MKRHDALVLRPTHMPAGLHSRSSMLASRPTSRIAGTGRYAPEKVLSNHDLERMVDTSDEWITERTGIRQRHIAAEGETTSDMAAHAARSG